MREHGHGEYRLRYPMKLVNGKVRAHQLGYGPDRNLRQDAGAAQGQRPRQRINNFIGSGHNNEQAYLLRKFVSFWGSNNCDHQAHLPLHHRGGCGEHLGATAP